MPKGYRHGENTFDIHRLLLPGPVTLSESDGTRGTFSSRGKLHAHSMLKLALAAGSASV